MRAQLRRVDGVLGEALSARLAAGPLVLKRSRVNGGLGVWKVELAVCAHPHVRG